MGLIDKIKGILFDEEVEEIPEIKSEIKESKKEVIVDENPIKEIKLPKVEPGDVEVQKNEPSFTFPIDFDDEEDIYEPPKVKYEEVKKPIKKEISSSRDYSSFLNKKDDKKQFKPTPIISPVYGILDQNYKKEDVIVKKDILRKPTELSLEEVRKRAFGSLEDDIEQNLVCDVIKEEEKKDDKVEIKTEVVVEEPVDKSKTIGELMEEDSMTIDIPNIESISDDETEYNISDVTDVNLDEPKNSIEDLLEREENKIEDEEVVEEIEEDIDEEEADLFSLIDSMYEEKGE